jgi:hypothetical protein
VDSGLNSVVLANNNEWVLGTIGWRLIDVQGSKTGKTKAIEGVKCNQRVFSKALNSFALHKSIRYAAAAHIYIPLY